MVAICCFQCDPRLATYIIATISVLHFTVETILLANLDTEHRLVAEDDGIKFYTVFATHIFLLAASLLLFYAAYALIRFLLIPWLIGCAFNLIIYIALLTLICMRFFTGGLNISIELEKGLFIILTIATLTYCMWIVLVFFMELGKEPRSATEGEPPKPKSRSVFKLYDDTDTEAETQDDEERNLFPSKKASNWKRSASRKISKEDTQPLLDGKNGKTNSNR